MNHIQLDDQLLKELGLDDFAEADKNAMLKKIYESLELRVGMRMARIVTEEQLKEFEELTNNGKDAEAAEWLKQHVPNYQQIATEELDNLKTEVRETSRRVLEKSIQFAQLI